MTLEQFVVVTVLTTLAVLGVSWACYRALLDRIDSMEGRVLSYLDRNPRVEYKMVPPPPMPTELVKSERTMLDPPDDESEMDDGMYDPWKEADRQYSASQEAASEDDGGQGDTGFDEVDKRRYRD